MVRADGPFASLDDLVRAGRERPEEIVVSTSGIGTDDHLLMVMLQQQTGARFTLVHFNGAPQQRNALMGGQVQANTVSIGEYAPNPDGMRFIAHGGAERSRFAPQTQTMKSMGLDIEMYSERGIVMPAGTPPAILERMREAARDAAADPATRTTFEAQFIEPAYEPGPDWEARMRRVQGTYADLWRRQPWRA
jgi:tripartite-type tricarboxylate transporter receptor subunit TctC